MENIISRGVNLGATKPAICQTKDSYQIFSDSEMVNKPLKIGQNVNNATDRTFSETKSNQAQCLSTELWGQLQALQQQPTSETEMAPRRFQSTPLPLKEMTATDEGGLEAFIHGSGSITQ